jgi:hypothetical protein
VRFAGKEKDCRAEKQRNEVGPPLPRLTSDTRAGGAEDPPGLIAVLTLSTLIDVYDESTDLVGECLAGPDDDIHTLVRAARAPRALNHSLRN